MYVSILYLTQLKNGKICSVHAGILEGDSVLQLKDSVTWSLM